MVGGTVNRRGQPHRRCARKRSAPTRVLAGIARMVEAAQGAKLPIEATGRRGHGLVRAGGAWPPRLLTFLAWLASARSPALSHRPGQRRRGADHRLPLRHGPGDADLHHGRNRPGGRAGHPVPTRRCAAAPARCQRRRLRQDRHADRGPPRPVRFHVTRRVRRRTMSLRLSPPSKAGPSIRSAAPSSGAAERGLACLAVAARFAPRRVVGVVGTGRGAVAIAVGASR